MKRYKEFFYGIGILLIYFVISVYLSSLLKNFINSNNFWISNLSAIFVILLIVVLLILINRKEFIKDFKDFKKNYKAILKVTIKYYLYGFVIMVFTNNILTNIIGDIAQNEMGNRELLMKMPLYSAFVMCFLGPISEEITFRMGFKKAFKNENLFCIFTALLFGYAHVMGQSLINSLYIIPYATLGFFFAKAYYKTNNIFSSISAHIFHNTLSILIIIILGVF